MPLVCNIDVVALFSEATVAVEPGYPLNSGGNGERSSGGPVTV